MSHLYIKYPIKKLGNLSLTLKGIVNSHFNLKIKYLEKKAKIKYIEEKYPDAKGGSEGQGIQWPKIKGTKR